MPRPAPVYSFLCFFLGISCLGFLTLEPHKADRSFYFSPLSETRLAEALKSEDEPERIIALAELMVERDPRNVRARTSLFYVHLRNGDVSALETHYFPLFNINSRNSKDLIKLLVTLSEVDSIFATVNNFIVSNRPKWGVLYLDALLKNSPREPSEYQRLYEYYPERLSSLYSQILMRFGVKRAYSAFLDTENFHEKKTELIMDENFSHAQYAWPFGWRLNEEIVERKREGGVTLFYFGRSAPLLMEQVVRPGLGWFQVQISMAGEASREKGYFQLRVKCWQGAELSRLNISNLKAATKNLTLDFGTTKEKCNFVQLQLYGQPGNFPESVRGEINMITMRPIPEPEL